MLSPSRKALFVCGIVVLALGLSAAAVIYATADDEADNTMGYEIVNGVAYPVATPNTKRYRHELERYGGKMAVVTDEFGNWFAGLWHGRPLACTLAVLTVALAGVIFLVAYRFTPDRDETP